MKRLILLLLLGCEGPAGPAGPPGLALDATIAPDAVVDAVPTPDATARDAAPVVDAGALDRGCPPRVGPAGLGGPVPAVVSVAQAQRWRDFRAAREQERLLEAWDPALVQARFRVEQAELDRCVDLPGAVDLGRGLFLRSFTAAEGHGDGAPRLRRFQDADGGPDASRCVDCHWKGGFAGAGDRADNTYAFGDGETLATQDLRNPPALWGAGWAALIAREMTGELQAQADVASRRAVSSGAEVRIRLAAKGVDFGALTALPDGSRAVEGVAIDADLMVRPFGWKGTFGLRDFVGESLHLHLGLQAEELGRPEDEDGVAREITAGQLSALVLFLATLDIPTIQVPEQGGDFGPPLSGEVEIVDAPEFTERWLAGAERFADLGCASCHVPFLPVADPRLDVGGRRLDLNADGARPRPQADGSGTILVPVFSDFRRHRMGPRLSAQHPERGVDADVWLTRRLWGLANTAPYLHDGSATTFDEAIALHGGEAEFASIAFGALPEHDRASLRVFLNSLRRGPALRIR